MCKKTSPTIPILFFLLINSIATTSIAQEVDISQYFDQSSIPFINRSKLLKVDIKWDMDGKSQVLLNEGLNYLEEGNLGLALDNFNGFLTTNNGSWIGHYYRGQVLMRLSRFKEAETEFAVTTRLNSKFVEGYIEWSEALEHQRSLFRAEETLLKAVDINPKYVYAYYKLGNLALLRNQTTEALKYYKKCNKIDPKFPDAYMAMGIISASHDKKFDDALSYMNKSLAADSTYTVAYFWRGRVFLEKGEKQKCLNDWNRFVNRNPRNQFGRTMRACLNTELGNYESAFSDFQKILQSTTVDEDKFQAAQTALDKRIDLQFAANYLNKTGYGLKEEAFANLKAGFCLMVVGKNREAMDYLRKADRMATSPAICFLMAIGYEHGGVHKLAFQYYSKTLELDKDVFDAHKKRAVYLMELKQWAAANRDIDEMFRLQPNNPSAYRLRGLMQSNQKKYNEAIADLSVYIKTDSADTESLRTRATCYTLTKKPEKASQDYIRILKVDKQQAFLESLIGEVMSVNDTLNTMLLLKEYYHQYATINSFVEISKIWIAQKKYGELAEEIKEVKEKIRSLEKSNNQFIKNDYSEIKSQLAMVEGMLAYSQSMYKEAIDYFTASLKENQENLESKYLRGKCYVKASIPKKALEDFTDLKEKKYKDAEALCVSLVN